jgi:hypothetical protein
MYFIPRHFFLQKQVRRQCNSTAIILERKKYRKGFLMTISRPKYPDHYLPRQLKCGLFSLGKFLTHEGKVRNTVHMWIL